MDFHFGQPIGASFVMVACTGKTAKLFALFLAVSKLVCSHPLHSKIKLAQII